MGYGHLYSHGELKKRSERLTHALSNCTLCPHQCGVNRLENERGFCGTGERAVIASYGPHYGEERPLVGPGGSGTIFFAHCNLKCVFCQNYSISIQGQGQEVSPQRLAQRMLSLQKRGASNINLVTPSHVVPQILDALSIATQEGLTIPLVYNSGGYDQVSLLKELEGVVDIYMPDIKYLQEETSLLYSGIRDYPKVVREALQEMHSQVGDLVIEDGLAVRGLIVRHLLLPNNLEDTYSILKVIAEEISPHTYVNLMDQYYPAYRAHKYKDLTRPLSYREYAKAKAYAKELGLDNLADP